MVERLDLREVDRRDSPRNTEETKRGTGGDETLISRIFTKAKGERNLSPRNTGIPGKGRMGLMGRMRLMRRMVAKGFPWSLQEPPSGCPSAAALKFSDARALSPSRPVQSQT